MPLIFLFLHASLASDDLIPVLYTGDAWSALDQVVATGREDPHRLLPVPTTSLAPVAPTIRGATFQDCSGSTATNAEIQRSVDLAEDLFFQRDMEKALALLDKATAGLACLNQALESSLASRVHLLRGAALLGLDQVEPATEAFRQARIFEPDLVWDADLGLLPNEFQQGRPPGDPARLHLSPTTGETHGVLVDGRALLPGERTLSLPAGRHVVQVLDPVVQSLSTSLEPGHDAWLLTPADTGESLFSRIGDPDVQRFLPVALAQAGFPSTEAWVVHGTETWRCTFPALEAESGECSLIAPSRSLPRRALLRDAGGAVFLAGASSALALGVETLALRSWYDGKFFDSYVDGRQDEADMGEDVNRLLHAQATATAVLGGIALVGATAWVVGSAEPRSAPLRVGLAPVGGSLQVNISYRPRAN